MPMRGLAGDDALRLQDPDRLAGHGAGDSVLVLYVLQAEHVARPDLLRGEGLPEPVDHLAVQSVQFHATPCRSF